MPRHIVCLTFDFDTMSPYTMSPYLRMKTHIQQRLMPASGVLENWVDDFLYMTRITEWGVLTYTCHPFVIGRGYTMLMLERLIEKLAGLGAVFQTMEAVVEEYLHRVT